MGTTSCGPLGGAEAVDTNFASNDLTETIEDGIFCETREACGYVIGVCVCVIFGLAATMAYLWFRDAYRDEDKPHKVPKCIFNSWGWIQVITVLFQEIIAFQLTAWSANVFWAFFGFGIFMASIDLLGAFINKCGAFFSLFTVIGIICNAIFLCYVIYEDMGIWTFGSRMIFGTSAAIQVVCEHNKYRADKEYQKASANSDDDGGWEDGFWAVVVGIVFDIAYAIFTVPIAYLRLDSPWKDPEINKGNWFGFFTVIIAWLGLLLHEILYTFKIKRIGVGIKSYSLFVLINVALSIVICSLAIRYLPYANEYRKEAEEAVENDLDNAGCHLRQAVAEWRIHIGLIVWCMLFIIAVMLWWVVASKRKQRRKNGRQQITDRDDPYRL